VNGENIPYSIPDPSIKSGILFTVESQTYTAVPEGFILGSTPISAGGLAATIFGQVISIGTQGAVIDGESIPFSTLTPGTHTSSPVAQATRSAITVGSLTFTAGHTQGFSISGQTLTPGGVITISGTPITITPSATALIVGSTTVNLGPTTGLPVLITDRLRAQRASISLQARL